MIHGWMAHRSARMELNSKGQPICGAPCPGGGSSSWRKHSNADMGLAFRCNRVVKALGLRCWQHAEGSASDVRA